jgi:3-methyladenine DNA glycosylase/8-oxoguanine DNA glycosylase
MLPTQPNDTLQTATIALLQGNPVGKAARAGGYRNTESFAQDCVGKLHVTPNALRAWKARGRYRIDYGGPFHLEQTLGYLGRDPANLSERIAGSSFTRFFPSSSGPVLVTLKLGRESCLIVARPPRSAARALELHRRIVRFLGLKQPIGEFYRAAAKHPVMARLIRQFPGVRIPQLPSLWEALCWAVIGQQINLAFAYRLRNRLIAVAHGVDPNGSVGDPLPFPAPEQVLKLSAEDLLAQQFSRQKARYVLGLAAACHNGDLAGLEAGDHDWESVESLLLAQTGLGPWSTAYAMMRGLGYLDGLPVGDTGLRTALQRTFSLSTPPTIADQERLMEPFRPFRSLATYYLWKSLATASTD